MGLEICNHLPGRKCPHKTLNCDSDGKDCIHVLNNKKVGDIHDLLPKIDEIIRRLEDLEKQTKKFLEGKKELFPM